MTAPGRSPIGFGCMRLATSADRDRERGLEVIAAAIDAGARLLDTADAYALDDDDAGWGERLVAEAVGARGDVAIVTKGGLTRPRGRWVPRARAKHLLAAAEASAERLGRPPDLYLLHAPDPHTPLATSARALAKIQDAGLARAVGLSNVNTAQLIEAAGLAEIAAVEIALSPFDIAAVRGGLVELCRERGVAVIAHSPLGGPRRAPRLRKIAALAGVARARGAAPAEIALAWLRDLDAPITPIPGATRVETARAAVAAQSLELDETERAALDALEAGPLLRTRRADRAIPPGEGGGDVVLIVGTPAAGKSTLARDYVEAGYLRLNRDERGGKLADLVVELDRLLAGGDNKVVLDNTYASRAARNEVLETAWRHGVPARCVFADTPIEEAQINAVERIWSRHGRLLEPDELKKLNRKSPAVLPPRVLFDFRRGFEDPAADEGFASIEVVEFARRPRRGETRALIVELDGVLRRSFAGRDRPTGPGDVEIIEERAAAVRRWRDRGHLVLATSWQPEVGAGQRSAEDVEAGFERTSDLLGFDLEVIWCRHPAGPPACWCRKPLPGLGVALIRRHHLDVSASTFVGRNSTDRLFAERLGFEYLDAAELS
jgi:aryl-alcohol dehydrogenase-like predicted oxidoreductase/histidinol phosphatase-like enzyme/predicted kinase